MLYQDETLEANVVTPNLTVNEDGLIIPIYNDAYKYGPYGEKLLIYHFGRKTTHPLTDVIAARRYFETVNPDWKEACPPGREGYGVPVLASDRAGI